MKLEAGKEYRTRDGCKGGVYSTGNGGRYPIHAWVEQPKERRIIIALTSTGRYNGEPLTSNFDFISEWSDRPVFEHWDALPKEAVAVVKLQTGEWWWANEKPLPMPKFWQFEDNAQVGKLYPNHVPNWQGDWRNSLCIRPGCEEGGL